MSSFLLDDFTSSRSKLGTAWQGYTDRVMGGLSDMTMAFESEGGLRHLTLAGEVSLKNNGGFIQAELRLAQDGKSSFETQWLY